jgi:hypothetical protein
MFYVINPDGTNAGGFSSELAATAFANRLGGTVQTAAPEESDILFQKRKMRDAINAECVRKILAKWPMPLQSSINAGLYPDLTSAMQTDISTIVAESNAARNVVFALTDINLVRSYDPVADPGWADIGTYQQQEPV